MRHIGRIAFPLTLLTLGTALAEPAGPRSPKNVTEYLLALPFEALGVGGKTAEERRKLIEIEDLKNGYLRLSSGDWEGFGEVVLWRRPDKSFLLGVAIAHCGPVCGQHVRFYVHRDGKFAEVTGGVWSPLTDAEVRARFERAAGKKYAEDDPPTLLKLPRKGTSLRLVTQAAFTDQEYLLASWAFEGGKFVLQPGT
jgi:hypothetical protein